jgi:hypothetical protein
LTTYALDGIPAFGDWYKTKFDSDGNVRPGWRSDTWAKLLDLPKTPSPDVDYLTRSRDFGKHRDSTTASHALFSGSKHYHADKRWRADIPMAAAYAP